MAGDRTSPRSVGFVTKPEVGGPPGAAKRTRSASPDPGRGSLTMPTSGILSRTRSAEDWSRNGLDEDRLDCSFLRTLFDRANSAGGGGS